MGKIEKMVNIRAQMNDYSTMGKKGRAKKEL